MQAAPDLDLMTLGLNFSLTIHRHSETVSLVHAILGIQAPPTLFSGGRIPRIAWTEKHSGALALRNDERYDRWVSGVRASEDR